MSSVRNLRQLIRQERRAHPETMQGTIVSGKSLVGFDDDNNEVWVADVDVGGGRLMRDVPVKASERGGRFYADLGQSVTLQTNEQGRWVTTGPGSRVAGIAEVKSYTFGTVSPVTETQEGFQIIRRPYEFYMSSVAFMSGNPDVTFANTGGNDTVTRLDAGSFLDDGFLTGQSVRIANSALNDQVLTLAAVSASVLEFAGDPLVDEASVPDVSIAVDGTSLYGDGATPYPKISRVDQSTGLEV